MYNNIEESGVKKIKIGKDIAVECEFDIDCFECSLSDAMRELRGCPKE